LWDRNWRALGSFAFSGAAMGLASLWFVGVPLHLEYFGLMERLNAQVFIAAIAFSIEGFIYQIWDVWNGTAPIIDQVEYAFPKPAWLEVIAKLFFLVGLAAIWATTRGLGNQSRLPRQLLALSLLIPLAAPLGWVHYFLLTAYMLPGLLEHVNKRVAVGLIVGFMILLNAVLFYLMFMVGEVRVFPQLMLCIPFLTLLLGTVVFGAQREKQNPAPKTAYFAATG
jgi:hypothetical protein